MPSDPEVRRAPRRRGVHGASTTRGGRVLLPVVVAGRAPPWSARRVAADDLRQGVTARLGRHRRRSALVLLALALADRRPARAARISEPLIEVAGAAHRLREGEPRRAGRRRAAPQETQELARALNGLAERTGELLAGERAAVGDLSHRLRTPVTALRLDAEAVADPELAAAAPASTSRPAAHHRRDRQGGPAPGAHRPARRAATPPRGRASRVGVLVARSPRTRAAPLDGRAARRAAAGAAGRRRPRRPRRRPGRQRLRAHPRGHGVPHRAAPAGRSGSCCGCRDAGPGLPERPAAPTDRPGSTGLGLQIVRRTAAGFGGEAVIRSAPGHGVLAEVQDAHGHAGREAPAPSVVGPATGVTLVLRGVVVLPVRTSGAPGLDGRGGPDGRGRGDRCREDGARGRCTTCVRVTVVTHAPWTSRAGRRQEPAGPDPWGCRGQGAPDRGDRGTRLRGDGVDGRGVLVAGHRGRAPGQRSDEAEDRGGHRMRAPASRWDVHRLPACVTGSVGRRVL